MRKREWIWIAGTLLLAGVWAGQGDVGPEIVAERQAVVHSLPILSHPLGWSAFMDSCAGFQCAPRQYIYVRDQ